MSSEKKDQKEKEVKSLKKSTYSKKKKVKKNIVNGKAFVLSTFNNTIISISDNSGNIVSWSSAGQKGFKGSRKSTPYAAQVAADSAAAKALEYGMKTLTVEIKDQKAVKSSKKIVKSTYSKKKKVKKNILNPLACNALNAVSLPEPGPLISTVKVFIPYSKALAAAASAAT